MDIKYNEKKDIEFTLRKDLKELFSKGPVTARSCYKN